MALDSCELTLDDIEGVCMGTAPDAFDGIHMKGEYLSDGSGAWNKPYMRSFVGGGTGVFAPIQGWYHVASGLFDLVLVIAEEKMSSFYPHAQAAFLTIFDHTTERPLKPNLLWIFAIEMNRYMTTYGLEKKDIAQVAVQHKRNAANHPCALLGDKDITVEDVLNSETLAWPVQRFDVSPVSDGAVAIVLAAEHVAKRLTDKPVWIEGVGWNVDTAHWTNRDLAYPRYVEYAARQAYEMAEYHGAAQTNPYRRTLRSLRLQSPAPPGRLAACRPRQSSRTLFGWHSCSRWQYASLSIGWITGCWQPHRRCGLDEDRRVVLAAPRRGRQSPGSWLTAVEDWPKPGVT